MSARAADARIEPSRALFPKASSRTPAQFSRGRDLARELPRHVIRTAREILPSA
jgi:hypothetical protein